MATQQQQSYSSWLAFQNLSQPSQANSPAIAPNMLTSVTVGVIKPLQSVSQKNITALSSQDLSEKLKAKIIKAVDTLKNDEILNELFENTPMTNPWPELI